MTTPASVPGDGQQKVVWVPTLADPAAPTVAVLNGGTAVDITCYLKSLSPGTEQATVTDNRLCTVQNLEAPGRVTETLEMSYAYDPQNGTPLENEAFVTLKKNTRGFLVWRGGAAYEDPFAAGDLVDVYPVTLGEQRKQMPEENGTFSIVQKPFINGVVQRDVEVV